MKLPTTIKNAFFYNPGSLFSNVGVLLLNEKRVQDKYQFINVDTANNENITPAFIRLNPFGKVPVLIDEGKVVYDSLTIAQFLDGKLKEENDIIHLRSENKDVINKVDSWRQVRLLSLWKGQKICPINQDSHTNDNTMERQLFNARQQILKYQQDNPDLYDAYQIRLKTHDDRSKVLLDHDTYLKHLQAWQQLLDASDCYLKNQPYLAGQQFTLVDIYAISFLYWSQQKLDHPQLVFESRPYLKKYYDLQLTRPSVNRAFF
ncbi:unnamed protein product [Cunninghamella blakesleeana]